VINSWGRRKIKYIYSRIKGFIRDILSLFFLAHSWFRLQLTTDKPLCLEIGSGPKKRQGWLTLDMCSGADVYWDLRYPLPLPEKAFKTVYCSHVLEHFSYPQLVRLLGEIHRVMQPGGSFLIAVPDASLYIDAYLGKIDPKTLLLYEPAVISYSPMDYLNYIFYMDGHHKMMFDVKNLKLHCEAAGFVSCSLREFDATLDVPERQYESLYMVCKKP